MLEALIVVRDRCTHTKMSNQAFMEFMAIVNDAIDCGESKKRGYAVNQHYRYCNCKPS